MPKTDAQLEAQARTAAAALAEARKVRVEMALQELEEVAEYVGRLKSHRDNLHEGETRNALSSVISILTSAPGMCRSEQASHQAVINAGAAE